MLLTVNCDRKKANNVRGSEYTSILFCEFLEQICNGKELCVCLYNNKRYLRVA